MKRTLAIVLALCIVASLAVIPISAQASEGAIQPTSMPVVASSTITIRVNIIDFTYNMPSGRSPGPVYSRWYMTGTVTNEDGVKIATARSGIFWLSDSECWLDLVIRKDIPERGDNVSITLDALTYATGNYIDINPNEPLLKDPFDSTGRSLIISYVVGTEEDGWGIGGESVLTDFDGELHYKIETLGLSTLEPPKGCLLEYSPSSIKVIEMGTEIEVVCKAWNCGDLGGAIEARVFDANTGETLSANWENRDIGNKSCVVTRKRITVNHDLLLGFQASHWDYEHADWIRDETKFMTIEPKACLLEYSPSSDKEIEKGTEIEVVCKAWKCGGLNLAIEARVFDAKTGETLSANWENRDTGNKSCVVTEKRITVNHDLLLGFQASHWDHEHADWIRDETKYVTIKPKPKPNFKVTNLIVPPSELIIGDTVTIIADAKNIGDTTGTYTMKIRINGATIHSEKVTLSPEETKSVKCYYTPQSEGNYEVEAGGLRRDFNAIYPPVTPAPATPPPVTPPPTPGPIPGFEAVFSIAGLLTIAYLLRRRK